MLNNQFAAEIKQSEGREGQSQAKAHNNSSLHEAMAKNDMVYVEKVLCAIANDGEKEANEIAKARLWLSAQAITKGDMGLARAIFKPFSGNLPLPQALQLSNLTETDLQKIVAAEPDWVEMAIALGYAYWQREAFLEAGELFHKLMPQININDSDAYHMVAEFYCDSVIRVGAANQRDVVKRFCAGLATPAQNKRYPFVYLGAAIYKDFTKATNGIFNFKRKYGLSGNIKRLLYEAARLPTNILKDKEELLATAMRLFAEAAKRPQGLTPLSGGCVSAVSPADIRSMLAYLPEPIDKNLRFADENDYRTKGGAVLFFACDMVYLREYALLLITSLAHLNDQAVCHIHVVNPDGTAVEIVSSIRQKFPQIKINFSSESFASLQIKPYYAAVRFVRALELLDLYEAPLFIVDADLVVEISMKTLQDIVKGNDIGLLLRTGAAPFPWTETQAGVAYFSNSAKSRQFLKLLKQVICTKFAESINESIWFVDQNALFSVYYFMRKELSVCNLLIPNRPLFSCYTRTVNRNEFTKLKLAEYALIGNSEQVR